MEILYISSLSSEQIISEIHIKTGQNPGFAIQKFSRQLVKGLINNGEKIVALSNPPITSKNSSKKFILMSSQFENGITYKYIPFINIKFIKHVFVFVYTFTYVFFLGI